MQCRGKLKGCPSHCDRAISRKLSHASHASPRPLARVRSGIFGLSQEISWAEPLKIGAEPGPPFHTTEAAPQKQQRKSPSGCPCSASGLQRVFSHSCGRPSVVLELRCSLLTKKIPTLCYSSSRGGKTSAAQLTTRSKPSQKPDTRRGRYNAKNSGNYLPMAHKLLVHRPSN